MTDYSKPTQVWRVTVPVEIEIHDRSLFTFHEQIGTADFEDGETFRIMQVVGNGTPYLIRESDEFTAVFLWTALVDAAVKAFKEERNEFNLRPPETTPEGGTDHVDHEGDEGVRGDSAGSQAHAGEP